MGYDLHITRSDDWFDPPEIARPISLEEWFAYVHSDPEMRLDGFAEATTQGGATFRIEHPGLAVWTKHPTATGENLAWIGWSGGNISVKNPDDEFIAKLCRIAKALNAKVQGDDGELYCETK